MEGESAGRTLDDDRRASAIFLGIAGMSCSRSEAFNRIKVVDR
jgi:hypothetical protein